MKKGYVKGIFLALIAALVLQSNAFALSPATSGSWYYPAQDGHGFSFEVGELGDGTPFVVAYWYVYDTSGYPLFLVGSGFPEGDSVEIEFVMPWGMVYGEFDSEAVNRASAGVAKFTFANDFEGTFEYFPSEWAVENIGHSAITIPVTKLFGVSMPDSQIVEVPVYIEVPSSSNAVVSQIRGEFNGWDGDTVFELTNGQVWQQVEYKYQYFYEYQPNIVIYQNYGAWYATVNSFGSNSEHVRVQRLQ